MSQSFFKPFNGGKIKIKKEVVPLGLKINSKNKNLINIFQVSPGINLFQKKKL